MIGKIKAVLSVLALLISVMGVITFSLFIFEEALQTVMFGTWAAQDAQRWDLVLKGCDTNRKINRTMKIVNYGFGWIQPFAFISYRAYGHSMDSYLDSLEAKVLAHEPELFTGRTVSIVFTPREIVESADSVTLKTGKISVIVKDKPEKYPVKATGRMQKKGKELTIDTRNEDGRIEGISGDDGKVREYRPENTRKPKGAESVISMP